MINRTTIPYRKLLLPACKECNNEIFSRLESKVRQNTASRQEYYLWALKIRYCLSIIDLSLPDDRSNPEKGPILIKEFSSIGHDFINHAFTHLTVDKFHFWPYPFGSVFILKNPCNDVEFGFVDVSHPHWALTVSLPGNKILAVLFTDRGLVKRSIVERFKSQGGLKVLTSGYEEEPTNRFTRLLTFKLLLFQYQLSNIPYEVSFKENGIRSKKLPRKLKYRQRFKFPIINEIADRCGIPNEAAQEFYNRLPEFQKG